MQNTEELFNNRLRVTGRALTTPTYTHSVHNAKSEIRYKNFKLASKRHSGIDDEMEVSIKEELMSSVDFDKPLEIIGEIRTVNIGPQLRVYVFALEVRNYDGEEDINEFEATVYTCKNPVYRITPAGKQITDVTLACIRTYKSRSDYFPTIFWGNQAKKIGQLTIGRKLYVKARMQSRKYLKTINGVATEKVAYEISAHSFEMLD